MTAQPTRLNLEVLEGRAVPSATVVAPKVAAPAATAVQATANRLLAGVATGTYACTLQFASTPSGFHFTGTANLKTMGKVKVQIDVYAVGFKPTGTARGRVTLTNERGTVVLDLTGPEQKRLSTLPSTFTYKVVGATGSYRGLKDTGPLKLVRTPDANPVRGGIKLIEAGTFRLTI